MLLFSSCIISKRLVGPSVAVLAAVIIGQAFAYGLVFDLVKVNKRESNMLLKCVWYTRCFSYATYQ